MVSLELVGLDGDGLGCFCLIGCVGRLQTCRVG